MKKFDFLVVGSGIFGVTTALDLIRRHKSVGLINPDSIPHPLAASTDISKVVRMEYGTDVEYLKMAAESIGLWRRWNEEFDESLFHEVGYLLLSGSSIDEQSESYESASYKNVVELGFAPERLDAGQRQTRFPAFNHDHYPDGCFHAVGGFAESGRAVTVLAEHARRLGADIIEQQTAETIVIRNNRAESIRTREGEEFAAGHIVICAGNSTPYLLPELMPYMKVTGHPVFHLKPEAPEMFASERFPVFAADISNTGWYGFPLHPKEGVVKVANHGIGLELHPEHDEREVYDDDVVRLRQFLRTSIPALTDAPIVYTRRCCYTDTLDGHFWIDRHPEIAGLTVGSGGSGHGFKMGPVIGQMIASVAEGGGHKWSDRYQWRHLTENTVPAEEARNL